MGTEDGSSWSKVALRLRFLGEGAFDGALGNVCKWLGCEVTEAVEP